MPAKANASHERVMVFIDGSNLYHVLAQNCGRYDLVFDKFIAKLGGDRDVVRTYYYNIRQDPGFNPQASAEQEKFLTALFETPYFEVKLGVHRRHGDMMVEKGVDVMMATDIVVGAFRDTYDTGIVVSGDGDFYPAMQAAKDLGKHIEVVAFDNNLSPEARRVADLTTLLKKSYFTGLWTTSRRARSTKGSEGAGNGNEAKPATRRQPAASKPAATKSADKSGSNGSNGSDAPSRKAPARRRPVRSASRSNGTGTPPAETEAADSKTPGAGEPAAAGGESPARRPARRRRITPGGPDSSDSGAAAGSGEAPAAPAETPVESSGSTQGEGGGSKDNAGSGGGSWWSRNRPSRRGSRSDASE